MTLSLPFILQLNTDANVSVLHMRLLYKIMKYCDFLFTSPYEHSFSSKLSKNS